MSQICRLNLLLQGACMSAAEAAALDTSDRARKRQLYAQGPRTHTATESVFRLVQLIGALPYFSISDSGRSNHHVLGIGRNHFG